jgi:hypothetical protein
MSNGTTRRKKCFVVMGFGEKVDFQTQRTLDLDKTYRTIIRKAVEDAGLECIRADDVIHAGTIDKPMYELLLDADLVVADLSTSNANALYELGVRHALRPHTTIVIAESQFKFPFDITHLLVRKYEHLGKGIDAEEAERMRADLKKAIETLIEAQDVDSPVYTFIPELKAPARAAAPGGAARGAAGPPPPPAPAVPQVTVSSLLEAFRAARRKEDWATARATLTALRALTPGDPYILQQLALATYKGKRPDLATALREARTVLEELGPERSSDPETRGLWGAVHKRLWETEQDRAALETAVRAYEKGFHLKDDYYNGINYAFLLNVRASLAEPADAIADYVLARRVRERVIADVRAQLAKGVKDDEGNVDREQLFWLRATLVEALVGTGDAAGAAAIRAEAVAEAPETWMPASMNDQVAKLEALLAQNPLGGIAARA